MKTCIKCKLQKSLTEFNKDKSRSSGMSYRCKACDKKYDKVYIASLKDGLHRVYYLPLHNYVGTTETINKRMAYHKTNGRDTTGYEIWKVFDNRKDALYFEALMHSSGYNGKHSKNMYK